MPPEAPGSNTPGHFLPIAHARNFTGRRCICICFHFPVSAIGKCLQRLVEEDALRGIPLALSNRIFSLMVETRLAASYETRQASSLQGKVKNEFAWEAPSCRVTVFCSRCS
jgi:hypothetical protein